MSKVIKVSVREVYGVPTVYPACPQALLFAQIAGTKTLTHRTLCLIEALGYTIEAEAPTIRRAA
jgi:hypothetical protein